jgi:hypothetical protein
MERWWNEFKHRWMARHPMPKTYQELMKLVEAGESNILITIIVQHKETALLQMNTGIKPFRNILNFILFHPST